MQVIENEERRLAAKLDLHRDESSHHIFTDHTFTSDYPSVRKRFYV